ncbi:MAG TPA: four-helix bundle copper-binding protein [Burkholderiales bacterium]
MDRRELLEATAAAMTFAAVGGSAFAADKPAGEHVHQHAASKYGALATSAGHCVETGQVCINHCLEVLATGDKELVACAQSVQQLISACVSLQELSNYNSKYVPAMAKVVMDVCKDCEEECKKHAKKHEQCKKCGEACNDCAKECKKVVG